jgi:hypothetical protein
MVVAFSGISLFFFVPETFWDRSPIPKPRGPSKRPSFFSRRSSRNVVSHLFHHTDDQVVAGAVENHEERPVEDQDLASYHHRHKNAHVGFASSIEAESSLAPGYAHDTHIHVQKPRQSGTENTNVQNSPSEINPPLLSVISSPSNSSALLLQDPIAPADSHPRNSNSPFREKSSQDYVPAQEDPPNLQKLPDQTTSPEIRTGKDDMLHEQTSFPHVAPASGGQAYTRALRQAPPKSFSQQLRIYHGRLNPDKWWKVALRPFILFAYPAILWSAAIYACSIGWLIVISESVAIIYRNGSYQFGALATGLVYLSPFIGGILGTAVAGKVSDIIVKAMARRNGGLYEPEFRLVMAAPIAITTVIGLIGFGWSAGVNDHWIVPTVFFGVVSFGCSLGSTTAITFCVDSYRQYAGEALVTLNFSKNIFHGLVFSLFVTDWLTHDGSKSVFMWIGIIQLIVLFSTIPMYIYGKRARMWTVRKNLMERF